MPDIIQRKTISADGLSNIQSGVGSWGNHTEILTGFTTGFMSKIFSVGENVSLRISFV